MNLRVTFEAVDAVELDDVTGGAPVNWPSPFRVNRPSPFRVGRPNPFAVDAWNPHDVRNALKPPPE